ncbi:MAG: hypothetical protein Q9167_006967 [Letrouitia subvulpina]
MSQSQLSVKKQQGIDFRAELQQQYTNYKNNLQQLAQRIGDVEQEAEEHKCVFLHPPIEYSKVASCITTLSYVLTAPLALRLVLDTLKPLPESRKCFRMINGVLVERTVKDVMPALTTNSEGLKKVLEELLKQYKKQQEEMEKWKVSGTCTRPLPASFSSGIFCCAHVGRFSVLS